MNFLAHDIVLPSDSPALMRVGAALPDLWALLPKRQLPLVVLNKLRANPLPWAQQLAQGILAHLRADATFHRHPEFDKRLEMLGPRLGKLWPGLLHPSMAAHVLIEMMLDRWLLQQRPQLAKAYYASFTPDHCWTAAKQTTFEPQSEQSLKEVLDRFVSSGFLFDYQRSEGLTMRFVRTLGRTPLASAPPMALEPIAKLVEEFTPDLAEAAPRLLEDVRQAVLKALSESHAT